MNVDRQYIEKYGTLILVPENEEEKAFLSSFFHNRRPTSWGLNEDGSLSILTRKATEREKS